MLFNHLSILNMATATVDACKKTLLSNKNEKKSMANNASESRATVQVEDVLSKCQEKDRNRVFEVDLHACKLSKIENCQNFPKLRILDFSCNQIKVIRGLDKNLELKELKLYSNSITRIEGLEKLNELHSLQLQDNKILKLGNGLQKCKKLRSLRLDCNEILSIAMTEMAPCSKLTYLNVSQNKLEDISFLNCLPLLEECYASNNKIEKIPDLGRCKKLQEIDLSYNKISSMSGIKSLSMLSILLLEHNEINNVDVSGVVKTLEELYIGRNRLTNVKKLPIQFPSLEVLDVNSNAVENLEKLCQSLQGCNMIRELNISDNPCTKADSLYHQKCIKSFPGLEVLDGSPVKRPQSSQGKKRPPMRPVSASQMLSTKHVEEQVAAAIHEQDSFQSMISSTFSIVYELLNKLPDKIEESRPGTRGSRSSPDSPRPASRCGNRARIQDAIAFAEQHFDPK